MTTINNASETSNTYVRGQKAAQAHQKAKILAIKANNARSEAKQAEWEAKARIASKEAAAMDLAFDYDENATIEQIEETHRVRANALFDRKQSRVLRKYRAGYADTTSASGQKSKNPGDDVAQALAGMPAVVVMAIADRLLGFPVGTLATKYEKLNEGQKRMNAGNRIRNGHKKGLWTIEQIVNAAIT